MAKRKTINWRPYWFALAFIAVVIIVVFSVRNVASQQLGARIFVPNKNVVVPPPPEIIRLHWSGSVYGCEIQRWSDRDGWYTIGYAPGVGEADCRARVYNPNSIGNRELYKTNSIIDNQNIKENVFLQKEFIAIGPQSTVTLRWVDGLGCVIFRWDNNTNSWVGHGTNGIGKNDCHDKVSNPVQTNILKQ